MKRISLIALVLLMSGLPALAASLGTAARSVIPKDVQQVINVDYRRLKNSDTAMEMKNKLIPANMKQFEDALKDIGVVPDRDMEQITLASFRNKDHGIQIIGIAQGQFPRKAIALKMTKQNIKSNKVNGSIVYPMAGGMTMVFLDNWTLLFGESSAIKAALDARDGITRSMNANPDVTDMITSVDQGTVWSVLDQEGTQTMLKNALGEAADLAEFDTMKKRLMGSRYTVDFDHGIDFNLNVITSDNVTAASLSSVMKAGLMFKKSGGNPMEKSAIDNTTVDSDGGKLIVHFKADDKTFQSLMDSPMFVAVTH
jgi:hypothetical protein